MKRRTFIQSTLGAAVAASLPLKNSLAAADPGTRIALAAIDAARATGEKVTLQASMLDELRGALYGRLLLPQNEGYENARRVFNPGIDRRPALIVQAADAGDVRLAVDFARENRLLLAVKCGGHSYSGMSTCDGGLMIDLGYMQGVRVDPAARRAFVAGGTFLGQLDHEAASHGLAIPLGTFPTTGVGGLATGGGFGRLARRWGLTLDNIRAVDVVTADGNWVHANERDNLDLLWAVRGGGGNFGVVTNFEFELHPMQPRVVGGGLRFPLSEARQVLSAYADYTLKAPDELYMELFCSRPAGAPDGTLLVNVCYSGDERNADKLLQPIRRFGTVLGGDFKAMSYLQAQGSNGHTDIRFKRAQFTTTRGTYITSGFVGGINADLVKAIVDGIEAHPKRGTGLMFQHAGGAIGRVPDTKTAFPHRYATHIFLTFTDWDVKDEATDHMRYARQRWQELEKHTRGFYINDMTGNESVSTVNANFGKNYPRLVQIKTKYDPHNLFRLNANVKPA